MEHHQTGQPRTAFDKSGLKNWLTGWRTEAKFWRIAALMAIMSTFVATAGIIYQSQQNTVIPYVLEVDSEKGVIRGVEKVIETYRPTTAIVEFVVAEFAKNIRTISIDPVVTKQNFLKAYDYVTPKGKGVLTDYCRKYQPFNQVESGNSCIVKILNTIKHSDTSYQVTWSEERFSDTGISQGNVRYAAIFNILMLPPKNEDQLRRNPAGVYVDFFTVSKESELP